MRAALAVATALGVGYIPFAPGTFGSLAGLALWVMIPPSLPVQASTIAVLFVAGAWSGTLAEGHFQGRDPGPVVIDEVMGMLATLFLVPVGWSGAVLGFLLFRVFDVIKPYPASRLEHLRGGLGIMADDLMAAAYAHLTLRAALALWPWLG
jgi:phosphatidylglycerophosphatase A